MINLFIKNTFKYLIIGFMSFNNLLKQINNPKNVHLKNYFLEHLD